MTTGFNLIDEALTAVTGDRRRDYAHPLVNMLRIAIRWSNYMGSYISPVDVVMMMIDMKLARETHNPKHDNKVDIVGYMAVYDAMNTLLIEMDYAGIEVFEDRSGRNEGPSAFSGPVEYMQFMLQETVSHLAEKALAEEIEATQKMAEVLNEYFNTEIHVHNLVTGVTAVVGIDTDQLQEYEAVDVTAKSDNGVKSFEQWRERQHELTYKDVGIYKVVTDENDGPESNLDNITENDDPTNDWNKDKDHILQWIKTFWDFKEKWVGTFDVWYVAVDQDKDDVSYLTDNEHFLYLTKRYKREEIREFLDALSHEGKLLADDRGSYCLRN